MLHRIRGRLTYANTLRKPAIDFFPAAAINWPSLRIAGSYSFRA